MSLKLGTQDIAGISQNKICNAHFLLEPIWSDHIINDISLLRADTFSWQSGDVYVTVYNHLVADLQGATIEYDGAPFVQPTLSANGTVGGNEFACFSSSEYNSNYITYKAFNKITSDLGSIHTYWCSSSKTGTQYVGFYNPTALKVTKLRLYNQTYSSGDGIIASGIIEASNDNSTYTQIGSFSGNSFGTQYIDVDLSSNINYYKYYRVVASTYTGNYATMGEIEITAKEGSLEYYRATDGHKICLADQETTIANIYSETGIAWYYILDTTNAQFKLPRTKYGFEGLRTNVGDKIDESLPNITGSLGYLTSDGAPSGSGNGALRWNTSTISTKAQMTSGTAAYDPRFNASLSSSTYQDNAPVQERATQMYLYFYVGDYSQTAIEQTAGLNSELFNGKADVNLANVTNTGTSLGAGWAMPSDKYIDLTLGASGSTYTAPANGWFYIDKNVGTTSNALVGFYNLTKIYGVRSFMTTGSSSWILLPVQKGDVVSCIYNATGTTAYFRFIYAQGSESEAS